MEKLNNIELWGMVMDFALAMCAEIDQNLESDNRVRSIEGAVKVIERSVKLEQKLGYRIDVDQSEDSIAAINTSDGGTLTFVPRLVAETLFTTYEISSKRVLAAAVHISLLLATIHPDVDCSADARDSVLSIAVYYLASCGFAIPSTVGFKKHLKEFQSPVEDDDDKSAVIDDEGFISPDSDLCS